MQKRFMLGLGLALSCAILIAASGTAFYQDGDTPPVILMEEVTFSGDDFAPGMGGDPGLLAPESAPGDRLFVSDVITAPFPFNAVVPEWTGPGADSLHVALRTSPNGVMWSEWQDIHVQNDWVEPDDVERVGQMALVSAADGTHGFVQYALAYDPETGDLGLDTLTLTFIDSTDGPTSQELLIQQREIGEPEMLLPERAGDFPKPFVVSRAAWCQHSDCNYTDGLEYEPVTHLIVHHTVSNNNSPDWAATVRAIWNFHTYSRGWGDIGYNYLVDPQGVIYEGHAGGDDVVGTHASGANAGSMAVALLGTFTLPNASPPGISPPQPMLNSAINLLAWKADQRDIDVFDASDTLPNIDWGLPNLMGHRDVYGTTECPGEQAHDLLPWMREQVAARIGLVSPFLFVDEQSGAFVKNESATWLVPPYSCGHNGHAWYAWSTTDPNAANNWAEWRPNIPETGRYRIDAYAPYCRTGRSETNGARYIINHADGQSSRSISHEANVGLWTSLGEFRLNAGTSNVIRLTNLAGDNGLGVWFDALRILPLDDPPPDPEPSAVNLLPAQASLLRNRAVTFTWQVGNPASVAQTTLQIATDASFSSVLVNQSWIGPVSTATHTFAQDHDVVYWRVLLSWSGPLIASTPTSFRLDATPPESLVTSPVYYLPYSGSYAVQWLGVDTLSGLSSYNIDYRAAGSSWVRWLSGTRLTGAIFTPPNPAQTYEFRSQAVDVAGNLEAVADRGDAGTGTAVILPFASRMPLVPVNDISGVTQ